MTPEAFRRLGHELVDWIADYRERLETLPVMSRVAARGDPGPLPDRRRPPRGAACAGGLAALDEVILPGITHWNHPSFFAYFPSNTSYASILADLVAPGSAPRG